VLLVIWVAGHGTTPLSWDVRGPGYSHIVVHSEDGRLVLGVYDPGDEVPRMFWWRRGRARSGLSLTLNDEIIEADLWRFGIALPFWLISGALLVPLAWRWLVWRDRHEHIRREEQGLCRHCGYDICASVGRCPECGALVPITSTALPIGAPA